MNQPGYQILYQFNVPKSQAGKKVLIYYTVYNSDETIFIARTQSGVKEFGEGAYGVLLSFPDEASYSIHWEIDGTPYIGNEEINIFNYRSVVDYDGYGL